MIDEHSEKQIVELTDNMETRFFGKYRGIVTDIVTDVEKEKEKMGFITVKIPEIYLDCTVSLVKPCVSFAGKDCGFFAFPKVGDSIWIEFEGGDQSRPIWTGYWWNKDEIPEFITLDTVALVSRTGHRIIFDDKNAKISLVHSKGPEIDLADDEIIFKVGRTKMVISSSGININEGTFKVKT